MVIYGIMTETNSASSSRPESSGHRGDGIPLPRRRVDDLRDPLAGPPASAAAGRCGWRRSGTSGRWCAVPRRDRRDLRRRVHRNRGRGHRRGGALVFALARRALTWKVFVEVLIESVRTTSMLFMILIGALIFATSSTTPRCLRPEGLRHPVRGAPDPGDRRDLRDLRGARHGDEELSMIC